MKRALALFTVLAMALAGCIQTSPTDPATGSPASETTDLGAFDPIVLDHDHSDPALHDVAVNFELLAHHPMGGSPTMSAGAHALDVKAGHLFAAAYGWNTAGGNGGVYIYNLSDPATPAFVGRYVFPGSMGGDRSMEATEDGSFVVLGTEAFDCAGHVNPFGPGIHLVDVRDKRQPLLVDFYPTSGTHAVAVHRIDGVDYVFAVSGATQNVFRIDTLGPLARLTPIGEKGFGHDLLIQNDPLLGVPVMYAADGGGPLNIYDVSDPSTPVLLGTWNIPDRGEQFYVHTVAADIVDGRRIVVVSSEDWLDYASPLWVLDATSFEVIETVGFWRNPGNHSADGLRFSLHNPRMQDGVLYIAHYHAGVWALDLRAPEKWAAPPTLGVYLPHEDTGYRPKPSETGVVADTLCGVFNLADVPVAFDVEVGDGVLYVADLHTGVYTLKPTFA